MSQPEQATEGRAESDALAAALDAARLPDGSSLAEFSDRGPTLVVFLRHAGCTFCRQALVDIALRRRYIESRGTRLVLVHMGSPQDAAQFFPRYGVGDLPAISDPTQRLYRAFGLRRGNLWELIHPRVMWRGLRAALIERHGLGRLAGDRAQLPGVFLIHRRRIVRAYRHRTPADRPDYARLAECDSCPS